MTMLTPIWPDGGDADRRNRMNGFTCSILAGMAPERCILHNRRRRDSGTFRFPPPSLLHLGLGRHAQLRPI